MSLSHQIRSTGVVRGTHIVNAHDTSGPNKPHRDGNYPMGKNAPDDAKVEKLRTGEHPNKIKIEDFHVLPAPLLLIERPTVHRMIVSPDAQ